MPGSDSAPRYQRLAAALTRSIEDGSYPVGSLLPTEQEICAAHGVSRYTVREALRRLVAQGYVRRRQGSGTEVIDDRAGASYLHSMRSLSELFEYAADTRLEVRSVALATPDGLTAQMLGRPPGRRWLEIDGVRRTRSGEPICHTRVWIHDDFAALGDEVAEIDGPIYERVERRFGVEVTEVVQEFSAEPFTPESAELLSVPAGSLAQRLVRRYLDASDRPLIVSASWHPAETFHYTMRLKRDDPAG